MELIDAERLPAFLIELAARFGAEFGCVHVLTPPEVALLPQQAVTRADGDNLQLAIVERTLREGLPQLFWANFFGRDYVELFDAETIRTTPAYAAHEAQHGWYLQLTADLGNIRDDHPAFAALRDAAKIHLGPAAFFDPDRPYAIVPAPLSETMRLVELLRTLVNDSDAGSVVGRQLLRGVFIPPTPGSLPPAPGGGEITRVLLRLSRELDTGLPPRSADAGLQDAFWRDPAIRSKLAAALAEIESLQPPPEVSVRELIRSRGQA